MTRARALALCGLAACSGGGDAWPRGADLAVVGESARLRWSDPLPATTAIFDGTRVRLRATRGETVGMHVIWRDAHEEEVSLELGDDDRADVRVDAFTVDYGNVRSPSTSMYGGSKGRGRYPDRLAPSEQPVMGKRSVYFDVAIARDAKPGTRAGVLEVGEANLPVELTILDVELADIAAHPRVWAYYDAKVVGADEPTLPPLFRAHGVVASPELTDSTWGERRAQVAGLPFIPVLLPRDCAAITREVRDWVARTAGTGQVPFAIPIDEPRTIVAQLRVRARAACVRDAGGGPGTFLYAVTQKKNWIMGRDVDVHVTPFGGDWTYNGTPPWAGAMVLDAADPGMRTWGWIGFRHDMPLWYVWDAFYWRDRYNKGRDKAPAHDLVEDPVSFDDGEDHGNLDGVLGYPGGLPSLRLKALRRGQQDRALLDALAACAGRPAADEIAAALVPTSLGTATRGERASWPANDDAWEAARHRVLDELVACRARAGGAPSPSP